METPNKMRSIAMKITAMLMLAIYITVSTPLPVLAAGTIIVTNGDNVQAGGDIEAAIGAEIKADLSHTGLTINGDLTVTNTGSDDTTGIITETFSGGTANTVGTATVRVEKPDSESANLTVTGGGHVSGITTTRNSNLLQGNADITVDGNVTVNSTLDSSPYYNAYGAFLESNNGSNVENKVNIGGGVTIQSNINAYGLHISDGNSSTTNVDIGKGISVTGKTANGIFIHPAYNASSTDVNLNIGKNSDGDAITVNCQGSGNDVSASHGINSKLSNGSNHTINVDGNIKVTNFSGGTKGIYVNGNGTNGTFKAQVKGDVESNGAGIYTDNMGSASADIIIDGTVRSRNDNIPAVILDADGANNGNVNVTAWKIEIGGDNPLFGKNVGAEIQKSDNSQTAVARRISYIIRVTQPEINNVPANVLSLANADGTAWNTKKAWDNGEGVASTMLDVARQDDRVYVKLNVPDGYQLVGVYADAAKTVALNMDDNGYYLEVPRGGGINVNVALTLIQVAPEPQPQTDPVGSDDTTEVASAATEAPEVPVSVTLTSAQIQSMIESSLAASLAAANETAITAVDLDLGNDPSLTADAAVAFCGGNVAKRYYFTYNRQRFALYVPVIDMTSMAYLQCLALLEAEPGKQAGLIRLSQLFAPLGVTLEECQ